MAVPSDFTLDWDLPEYTQLPKMFTNAKAAKKRKHKEFIMTDAELDQVVKIPKAAKGMPKAQPAAAPAAAADDAPQQQAGSTGAGTADHSLSKANRKKQKREAKSAAAEAAATAHAPAAAAGTENAGERSKQSKKHTLQEAQQQRLQRQQHQQQTDRAGVLKQDVGDGANAATLPKKSRKNKFKTQEFLQQQQQQQQVKPSEQQQPIKPSDQQQQQQPAKKQKVEALKQPQPDQQQQHQSEAQEQPAQLSKRQLKKLKHAQKQQQQQQQQANGNATAASPAAAGVAAAKAPSLKALSSGSAGGSKLMQQFKERLQGSRFRQLNEALYTQPGDASFSTMQEQPELFEQYHEGFQQQVKAWPSQPLDAAIKWLKAKPADWVVADFGCGEARLAATVQQSVHSLDLVAVAPGVIACNMAHTPLESASCDVAVFSLALMGTDYGSFLVEASRVLKPGGWLWVAEVRSRFADGASGKEDFQPLLAALKSLGFKLVQQDAANRMFVAWVFQKKGGVKPAAAAAIDWPTLRACVYKKR